MGKEAKKEQPASGKFSSIIFLILSVIIGIFCFIIGIIGVIGGNYIGILYLILASFTFLPRKIIKMSHGARFLISLAAFLIILFIVIFLNWHTVNMVTYHNMQENFMLNKGKFNISMIVYNTTRETSILVNNQEKTTNGYFLLINSGLTNLGQSAIAFDLNYDITDNQNKTYIGIGFSGSQDYFQPNLKKDVFFVFEIPSSVEGLKFHVRDKTGVHIIDLKI